MLVVETVAKIRRAYFVQGVPFACRLTPPEQAQTPALSSQGPAAQPATYQPVHRRGLFLPAWVFNLVPMLLVIGLAFELWGSPSLKPSTVFGGFWGNAEAVKIKTALAASQANLAAQNEENARLQKQLADFQARTERVSEAYKTVYQRATLMAQALSQAQEKFLEMQAEVAKESQEGNVNGAQIGSIVAGLGLLLGNKDMAAGGLAASRAFANEASTNINHQLQQSVQSSVAMTNTWQQGLPDASTLDAIVSGTADNPTPPADHAVPPPPPATYQQQPAAPPAAQPTVQPTSLETSVPALPAPVESAAYVAGAKDRHTWEDWFASLTGDAKAGADFWAEKRNDPKWRGRVDCAKGEGGSISDDFRATCEKAKTFLSDVDTNRTSNADYKRGWNSL